MFGYVIPNQAALDDEAKARYRTAYCGLCRRIGALHGLRGRLTLSYDLTFLDLLLSSLYEGESECITGRAYDKLEEEQLAKQIFLTEFCE